MCIYLRDYPANLSAVENTYIYLSFFLGLLSEDPSGWSLLFLSLGFFKEPLFSGEWLKRTRVNVMTFAFEEPAFAITLHLTSVDPGFIQVLPLGLQMLGLAAGMKTLKFGHGHHGANHPVRNLMDNTVLITSQNHGFCIDDSSLPQNVTVTHRSLFDDTIQGIHLSDRPAFGFQGHPEASPGPHDAAPLFDHFLELLKAQDA